MGEHAATLPGPRSPDVMAVEDEMAADVDRFYGGQRAPLSEVTAALLAGDGAGDEPA